MLKFKYKFDIIFIKNKCMFAQVVGSIPTLPTEKLIIICIIKQLCESVIESTVSNLISILKKDNRRSWCFINTIFMIVALCGVCRKLAQR
ncbi:hypothetical protein BCD72_001358 [Clostridium butyricum]|nr:hypothetical protein [Clostridium butyricum]MBA8971311.1 hypothetical protein [Clostridium butyricum]NOW36823.1 hypothetical protein [Clostridium butyricum]RGR42092.1 hypothetical protein DWY48_18740 [Clostridium butyricum]